MQRTIFIFLVIASVLFVGCGGGSGSTAVQRAAATPFPVLDGYGEWISLPALGEVWHPRVSYDWRPYAEGNWAWTDRGWMWLSDEPFGWVVYHYGYWDYDGSIGWVWIPGYDWSPARVEWFTGDDYVGWAPLPPPGITAPEASVDLGSHVWLAVPIERFTMRKVGHFRETSAFSTFGHETSGEPLRPPDPGAVEKRTHERINLVRTQSETVKVGDHRLVRMKTVVDGNEPSISPGVGIAPGPATTPPPLPTDLPTARRALPPAQPPPATANPGASIGNRGRDKLERRESIPPPSPPPAMSSGEKIKPVKENTRTPRKDAQSGGKKSTTTHNLKPEKGKPALPVEKVEKHLESK